MCDLYFKKYSDIVISEQKLRDAAEGFMRENTQAAKYLSAYMINYMLQQSFKSYAAYSFLRCVREGIMHLNMVLLFDVLCFLDVGELSLEMQSLIMSAYNRRPFFNRSIRKEMYEALRIWER